MIMPSKSDKGVAMEIPFASLTSVHGHRVYAFAATKPIRLFHVERTATVKCSCGAELTIDWKNLPCKFTLWEEQMRIKHYIDVIAAVQTHGVDAVKWLPNRKQSVPHSGEHSRDSVPPGHNYESDDDFALPFFDAKVPKRGQPPGSID